MSCVFLFSLCKYINLHKCIYIYSHPQTVCFILSELISAARQTRFPKLGSKPG